MLIDTDVLIWSFRGNEKAIKLLQALPRWQISAVSYIELVQGCRNKKELGKLRLTLDRYKTAILHLSAQASERAVRLVEEHALSHGLQLGDALIAGTALEHAESILTANTRHFAVVAGLETQRFTPE